MVQREFETPQLCSIFVKAEQVKSAGEGNFEASFPKLGVFD